MNITVLCEQSEEASFLMPCALLTELPTERQNNFYGFNPNSNIVILFSDENNPRALSLHMQQGQKENWYYLSIMLLIQATSSLNFKF